MIYVFIVLLIIAQAIVVWMTIRKTKEQKNIFSTTSQYYRVETFYIPKFEIKKISYDEILSDKEKYKNSGDTIVEKPTPSGIEDVVTCSRKDKISVNLIQINPMNGIAKEIQRVINNYLLRNKGAASDYGLIKDIVERNCGMLEHEINTQTPWPLYFGLMGTMAGIILGIGSIVMNEGGFSEFLAHPEIHIGLLMGDVAAAMIVSFVGIGCTTYLTYLAKEADKYLETTKNVFYSWFQTELMPIISKENASTGLRRLEENLNRFNSTFETNVRDLNNTFKLVKGTSQSQADLLKRLQEMDLVEMANANVAILRQFNQTVGQLEEFNKYIDYAQTSLDDIQKRNNAITEATITLDQNLDRIFSEMKDSIEKQVKILGQSLTQSGMTMDKFIAEEERKLGQYGQKVDTVFDTIQSLAPIINGLNDWRNQLNRQTVEIGRLAQAINNMPVPDGKGHVVVPQKRSNVLAIAAIIVGFILTAFMAANVYFTMSLNDTLKSTIQKSAIGSDSIQDDDILSNDTVSVVPFGEPNQ